MIRSLCWQDVDGVRKERRGILSWERVRTVRLQIKHEEPSSGDFKSGAVHCLLNYNESNLIPSRRPQGHFVSIGHQKVSLSVTVSWPRTKMTRFA